MTQIYRYKYHKPQQTTQNPWYFVVNSVLVSRLVSWSLVHKAYGSPVKVFLLMTSLAVMLKRRDFPHKFVTCCLQYLYLHIKFKMEGINTVNDHKTELIFKEAGCLWLTSNDIISERNILGLLYALCKWLQHTNLDYDTGLRTNMGDFRWFAVVCDIYTYIFGSFIIDSSLFALVCCCLGLFAVVWGIYTCPNIFEFV